MFATLRQVRLLWTGAARGFLQAALPVCTSGSWFGSGFRSWRLCYCLRGRDWPCSEGSVGLLKSAREERHVICGILELRL